MADVTMSALCQCGCGHAASLAPRTRGVIKKGDQLRYLPGHARRNGLNAQDIRTRIDALDPSFCHWLAGFIDGEGCFTLRRNPHGSQWTAFALSLHVDDAPILDEIQRTLGIGHVTEKREPSKNRFCAVWSVSSKPDCRALVTLLDRYPLRAKKRDDFKIWRKAVRVCEAHQYGDDWSEFNALRVELTASRPRRGPVREVVSYE